METVFKVGMKVYDQINFPNMEGKVVKIHEDESKYPLGVCFNENMSIHYYDLEGRFRKEKIPTLSTKPYKVVLDGFEQKEPVPTFEDAWKSTKKIYVQRIGDYEEYEGYTSQEMSNAFEALRKLIFLRDYYNEGWQPDWNNDDWKYVIITKADIHLEFIVDNRSRYYRVLHFKSKEIANKFLKEQKELLEIAKPLL